MQCEFDLGSLCSYLLTLYHKIPKFNRLDGDDYGNIEEKEVTSIFSFSHNVFTLSKTENQVFKQLVHCNCFEFGLVKKFVVNLIVLVFHDSKEVGYSLHFLVFHIHVFSIL